MAWLTVLLGTISVAHAGWLFVRFASVDKIGARAVKWMLFGQTVSMVILTLFAYAEWVDAVQEIDSMTASLMRDTAFVASLSSTLHLGFVINKVDRLLDEHGTVE
jgi:hypothetical protein